MYIAVIWLRRVENPIMTFPIKKESILNCLMMRNRNFIYTRVRSRKLIGPLGER